MGMKSKLGKQNKTAHVKHCIANEQIFFTIQDGVARHLNINMTVVSYPLFRGSVIALLLSFLWGCVQFDQHDKYQTSIDEQADFLELDLVFLDDREQQWPVIWWQEFADAELNHSIDLALTQNYSLKAAAARVEQSLAMLQQQTASEMPELTADISLSRSWLTQSDQAVNQWDAGLTASYEVDLWGSIAALDSQAQFNLDASKAAYRTLANTVASQVAIAWFGIQNETENLQLLEAQFQRLDIALNAIKRRQAKGQAQLSDVLQQQQLQESLKNQMLIAQSQLDLYRQQLALWTGGIAQISHAPLNSSKARIATAIQPVESLQQVSLSALKARPDIQQAFYTLQAANAGLAAALSNRYPRLTLSASYGSDANKLDQLFDDWIGSLMSSILLPIIDGGQRASEQVRQQAVTSEALANFQQTLLEAAAEVQQNIVLMERYSASVDNIEQQLALAKTALKLSNSYFKRGQLDFLAFLNAQQEVLSLEQQRLNAQWELLQSQIQLLTSVSHGYLNQPNQELTAHDEITQ